ncbi:MAG: tRNA epoxyqueuosine(34) reductase QueG [Bacteroidaceae bacterium]|nr:tRNA epoxyqueuosine(34) reductase QueG [Bacteroidaceae bacterium]
MNSVRLQRDVVKAEALRLGFSHCGLAPAEEVDKAFMRHYEQWLSEGRQAGMHYMERYLALRRDPRLLLPGARTVVSLAMSYNPGTEPTQPALAWYAQGRDYHDVLRQRLQILLQVLGLEGRICVDTAPVMEKYWAWRCGLGWIGRHTQLVVPREGSAFFLAELLLTQESDHYDTPLYSRPYHEGCGRCRCCIEACPTLALSDEGIDARRCLSYLTIEHRGPLPQETCRHLSECFYGCDRCMRACPHLSHEATPVEDFIPSDELLSMSPADWLRLTPLQYQSLFRGSAVKRAKYEGLMRNIQANRK